MFLFRNPVQESLQKAAEEVGVSLSEGSKAEAGIAQELPLKSGRRWGKRR